MKASKFFGDKTKIYNIFTNVYIIYSIIYATVMFIAGGDGIIFGIIALAPGILSLFIGLAVNYIFLNKNTEESQINRIIVSDNSIVFKYTTRKAVEILPKNKTVGFCLDELNIKADVSAMICDEKNTTIPNAFIILNITQKNGSILKITDDSTDIDHSLELLKFLNQLDCFSYKLEADTFFHPTDSVQLENAIGNYLKNNIYDKEAFKYYSRRIYLCIGFICCLLMLLLFITIFTVFGLEMVFHITL